MAPAKKTQKLSLGEFLGDQSLGSWADEMEDMPVSTGPAGYGGERRAFSERPAWGSSGGDRGFGGGDRLSGYAVREQLPLPSKPPYTAHLGNLSFDATDGDIHDFFADCEVTSVRIVEDQMDRKPKGFGYVEFGTLDGLKKALELNGTQFQGRNIRISVADPPKNRGETREFNDWTRKGPLPDLPNQQRRVSDRGGYRGYEPPAGGSAEGGVGMERGGSRKGAPSFEGDGKVRDFGNWERKGPLSPAAAPPREGRVRSNDGPRERKLSPAWGEGRSQNGSRPPRREFSDRPPPVERQPTAADLDDQWRSRMKPDAPTPSRTPEASTPTSPATTAATPAGRPRLNLQKRTVSEVEPALPSAASTSDGRSNPFGAARPIDTAAREREIEEKRQLAVRQKKEGDEKAREERRARETSERAAEKERKASVAAASKDAEKPKSGEKSDENGAESPTPGKSFEILRRMTDENGEADETDEPANGKIVDDKAVKPKEVVVEPKKEQGSWRRKDSTSATPKSATENLEEDGWSTVQKNPKQRGGRRGSAHPSRAIAS